MSTYWVGVDIAKDSFVAWVAGDRAPLGSYPNSRAGFSILLERLSRREAHLVMEPTGGYEAPLAYHALEADVQVSLVNPARVRDWAKGEGRRAKTDRQDAKMLADYGADKQPRPWQPVDEEVEELENLLRRRSDLETMIGQERNRREAAALRPRASGTTSASIDRLLGILEGELEAINSAIKDLLARHTHLHAGVRLLGSVPGIGARTALPMLVLLERWRTLTGGTGDAKGLVAHTGLDPQPHESGTSVRGQTPISRMGDRALRHQLFMAALGGVRGKGPLKEFYQRLLGRGKPKMVALIAAARKIVVWAWAVYRRGQPFSMDQLGKTQSAHP